MNLGGKMKKKLVNCISNLKKNKFLLCIAILIAILVFIVLLKTFGRYESNATGSAEAEVAFFVVDQSFETKTILLGEIVPSSEPYVYKFLVSNFNSKKRAEVNIEYDIEFITTTNLPLEYEIYKNENYNDVGANNIISNSYKLQDDYGTYFNHLIIDEKGSFSFKTNQTDEYYLVVKFNENYKDNPYKYEGVVESVRVEINAKQVI